MGCGRSAKKIQLSNVVKKRELPFSLICYDKALETGIPFERVPSASSRPKGCTEKITATWFEHNSTFTEEETFFVVDECPGEYDAILRHDIEGECDNPVKRHHAHPIVLKPKSDSQCCPNTSMVVA